VLYGDNFLKEGKTGRELREFSRMFNHRWTQMNQQLGLVDEWITGLVDWLYQARLGWIGLDYQGVAEFLLRQGFPLR
jgi:hypothetical protein